MNEYIVSAEQEGTRLDVFLTEQMEGSRSYIQTLIKGGHVIVGGKVGKANLRLTPNMVIQVEIPEPESVEVKPEDIPLDVLYEDHDIIIVNKARGMVVHPAVGNYSGTLVNALFCLLYTSQTNYMLVGMRGTYLFGQVADLLNVLLKGN